MNISHTPPAICAGCTVSRIGFCAGLALDQVAMIAQFSKSASYRKSQAIMCRTDSPITALIVRNGTVKLSQSLADGRQQIVDFFQAGDIAVRKGVGSGDDGSFEASTNVDVCEISFGDLERLCVVSPEINRSVLRATLAQVDRKNAQILMLGRKRAGERVAYFLMDMSGRAARRGEPPLRVKLSMSRAEIADYLSLTTETVSRSFSYLREAGIIHLPRPNTVEIRDPDALREICDGARETPCR